MIKEEHKPGYTITDTTQMRDAVIGTLYDLSQTDKRLVFCAADMGAKTLDLWRDREEQEQTGQFNEFGIAEQAMSSVAAGLAKEGKRPFIYAIANFVTKRIHEFHVLNTGVQDLPTVTLGVGTGFSYADSGPTHYMTEDISIMRTVPNLDIYSPSDSIMASELTKKIAASDNPTYMRLERAVLPVINDVSDSYEAGFNELREGDNTCIVATGTMVPRALEVQRTLEDAGQNVGVVDLYRLKPLNTEGIIDTISRYDRIVSLEEHLLNGGLGSILAETIMDYDVPTKLQRIGIDDRLVYLYGRNNIQRNLGLDHDSVVKQVKTGKSIRGPYQF